MFQILKITILSAVILASSPIISRGTETYFIDNQPVLLYKTINWWYDCLEMESRLLCGRQVRYQNNGDARLMYNKSKSHIDIIFSPKVANMLSIFKPCHPCFGPSYFQLTWINPSYFPGNFSKEGMPLPPPLTDINTLTLYRVSNETAHRLKTIEKYLGITLEGKINGLSDGRIALHPLGNLIKGCNPLDKETGGEDPKTQSPISLHLINTNTHEVLAEYLMVWE